MKTKNEIKTQNIKNENLLALESLVEIYRGTNILRPSEVPASIITLCSYILENDKETTNWKAVADMFKCFATEINNRFDKVFISAGSSVSFFEGLGGYRFQNEYNDVYSSLRQRVEKLKAECIKVLVKKCINPINTPYLSTGGTTETIKTEVVE